MPVCTQDAEIIAGTARAALLAAGLPPAAREGGPGNPGATGFTVTPEPGPGPARAAVRWHENGQVRGGDVPSQGLRDCLDALTGSGLQARHVPALRRGCLLTWSPSGEEAEPSASGFPVSGANPGNTAGTLRGRLSPRRSVSSPDRDGPS